MTLCTNAQANNCCECDQPSCNSFYVGFFGGGGRSTDPRVTQKGTAFFGSSQGGPLEVDAKGSFRKATAALGGTQFGYELRPMQTNRCCGWSFTPAAELEVYYLKRTGKSNFAFLKIEI